MKQKLLLFWAVFLSINLLAQSPQKPSASEIHEAIKKLNFLGSVLYVAAHPDDENTTMISFFANEMKARTAYLALTRGGGGQNLIGPEIRELLGVVRTQELLGARSIDGGEQMFTRAKDFGYSKYPEETLSIWNKDEVLGDVVWAIRNFKPDVIVNRFNHKKESYGTTHGHHTASAILSALAFDLAGDSNAYPDQLQYVDIWQPEREFFNTSWWFYGSQENFEKADKTNLISLELGVYYPAYGLSNNEISSLSRSMHKTQGFGSTGSRGSRMEYLELVKGSMPPNKVDVFEGVNTTWTRVEGGKPIGDILAKVQAEFDFINPSKSVPELIKAYKLIQNLEDKHWKLQKSKEIESIIVACSGLFLEAVADTSFTTVGGEVNLQVEVINRSNLNIELGTISMQPLQVSSYNKVALEFNKKHTDKLSGIIPIDMDLTIPYWLTEKGSLGMYNVKDQQLIGGPNTPRDLAVHFNVTIEGYTFDFRREVVYKFNSPVKGEVYKPFEIVPDVTANLSDKVLIFADDTSKEVAVTVRSNTTEIAGKVSLDVPNDWKTIPPYHVVQQKGIGSEQKYTFSIQPSSTKSEGVIKPIVAVNGEEFSDALVEMDYDHIPFQTVVMPSESKVVRLDLEKRGELIGYISGAGDAIPGSLMQIGYQVQILEEDQINLTNLKQFDAIVMGVRAFNTNERIKYYQKALMAYVNQGGTMIVQYNTSHRLKTSNVAPYELQLSRDRVTDENSDVRFLAPDHEVLNFPNKITASDFDGWVQERGLYFPNNWSKEFTPILAMEDKGKPETKGSLLVAPYGEGYYIYTGLSFFRELPAGVSGAYRLFTNLLSIGKE
ncbi:PIG-L family deacetylase [Urechidicola sp. KH5]